MPVNQDFYQAYHDIQKYLIRQVLCPRMSATVHNQSQAAGEIGEVRVRVGGQRAIAVCREDAGHAGFSELQDIR